MIGLLWFFAIVFWPLAAAAVGLYILFMERIAGEEEVFFVIAAIICLFSAAIGSLIFYAGYIIGVDEGKIFYLILIILWAIAAPSPKELKEEANNIDNRKRSTVSS